MQAMDWRVILPWTGLQPENGSPSKPVLHVHTGWWLWTVHCALKPQEPAQGSRHLLRTHARCVGQSWWIRHSGRQFGGAPNIPVRHEQTGRSSTTRQSALAPQGDGTHGFAGGAGLGSTEKSWSQVTDLQNIQLKEEQKWNRKTCRNVHRYY